MKSWISNHAGVGWSSKTDPGIRGVRFAIALLCSLSAHVLLISPALSQFDATPMLETMLGSVSAVRRSVIAQKSGRLQVFLAADARLSSARNAPPDSTEHAGQSPDASGADGQDGAHDGDASAKRSLARLMPAPQAATLPLFPTAAYYRPDELDKRPQIKKQIEPEFPLSVNPGAKGVVNARLFIDASGIVEQVLILSAQPIGLFEHAVVQAFEGARYTPGIRGGKPVRSQLTLAIEFDSEIPR